MRGFVLITVVSMATAMAVFAVDTAMWRMNSQEAFEKGEAEGLAISSDGELSLAPVLEEFARTRDLFIWHMIEGPDGTVYAGTGNNGRIYEVTPAGSTEVFFDSPEAEIHSLAIGPDGDIYAGAAPDGVIYRITPEGEGRVFCYTGENYIWSMLFNDAGTLYAATGSSGLILKISRKGRVDHEPVLDTRDANVMTMVPDGRGGFYAGTDGNGLVYHIDRADRVRLLYDADEEEIHQIVIGGDGALYAAAVTSKTRPAARRERSGNSHDEEEKRERSAVLYRIDASGAATKLWTAPQPLMLSLLPYTDNTILVGLAHRGWLYTVTPKGVATRVADTGETHALTMLRRRDGDVLLGMGNSGKIKKLTDTPGRTGQWISDVHDADVVSRWGRLTLRQTLSGRAEVKMETRTGNSSDPSEGWLPWSRVALDGDSKVASPPGRFIQVRLSLSRREGPSPTVSEISVAGQQINLPPVVGSINITTYRRSSRKTASRTAVNGSSSSNSRSSGSRVTASSARRLASKTIRSVSWQASDPNKDDLTYELFYRGSGENRWKLIQDDLTSTRYLWDTESSPEGSTQLKVVASDAMSNPSESALSGHKISSYFHVDHTGPVVAGIRARVTEESGVVISGVVSDAATIVHKGHFAVDGGDWRVFLPEDQMFDSGSEPFRISVTDLTAGEHTVVIRATDIEDNVGTVSVGFIVP